MAAGDRYDSGKPKDIVKHYAALNYIALCGVKNPGYSSIDWDDVTCLRCLNKKQSTYFPSVFTVTSIKNV